MDTMDTQGTQRGTSHDHILGILLIQDQDKIQPF